MKPANKEYSGRWLWLAVLAMIVPVAVSLRAFTQLPRPFTYPDIELDAAGVDQDLWDQLLRTYVAGGRVDYDGLKRTHLFKEYIQQLAHADPEKLATEQERLAFYCNAYNAFVMNGVIIHHIQDSVIDFKTDQEIEFFDVPEHILAGQTLSLNKLEHELIRPAFNEPRVHMALVCAAKSCPAIRPEAYRGEQLAQQLEDQAVQFANNSSYVSFNADTMTLSLSPILKWYGEDFGGTEGVLDFLKKRCRDSATIAGIEAVRAERASIAWFEYDWTLNSQDVSRSRSVSSKSLGSGSIPNE